MRLPRALPWTVAVAIFDTVSRQEINKGAAGRKLTISVEKMKRSIPWCRFTPAKDKHKSHKTSCVFAALFAKMTEDLLALLLLEC